MERLEKLKQIRNARFLKLFESTDEKEFEQRKAKWLRSEAFVDMENGRKETQGLAQGTSETLVTESDHLLRDQDAGMFRDIRTSTGPQPQA